MSDGWDDVRARLARRTDRLLADLREEWGTSRTAEPFEYGPKPWYPDAAPESVDEQLGALAGLASVVVCDTRNRREAVLVYNRAGYWEPPGGAVEGRDSLADTAVREAREETGLSVELTGLLSAGRVRHRYGDGRAVPLPVATFVGRRVDGSLRVEREVNDHPGVTRGVGLFGPDVLPDRCRDRDLVEAALDGDG
jgi:8-oxo-dGTP pyrophosphatase MutT (NUDIX family)